MLGPSLLDVWVVWMRAGAPLLLWHGCNNAEDAVSKVNIAKIVKMMDFYGFLAFLEDSLKIP